MEKTTRTTSYEAKGYFDKGNITFDMIIYVPFHRDNSVEEALKALKDMNLGQSYTITDIGRM